MRFSSLRLTLLLITVFFLTLTFVVYKPYVNTCRESAPPTHESVNDYMHDSRNGTRRKNFPLIFIGGFPRSGTTLMRVMLDAHPMIRCGEETRVIPRILGLRKQWQKNQKEWRRLTAAGINEYVLDHAVAVFILDIIIRHGKPAPVLCNKDPLTLKSTRYLRRLFPDAKFIFMIRDGRAVVHSMISRGVTITGFDLKSYRQCLTKWNEMVTNMYMECYYVGSKVCFPMHYEQLVLHPEKNMRELLKFLNITWNNSVLNHEAFIGKKISLSKAEKSTDQVVKPINTDALTSWVGKLPADVVKDMRKIAPMLEFLGYDPSANPPNYGEADDFVLHKTKDLHENAEYWQRRALEISSTNTTQAS